MPAVPRLTVRSRFIDGIASRFPAPFRDGLPTTALELLVRLPTDSLSCWVRGGSGLMGFAAIAFSEDSRAASVIDIPPGSSWAGATVGYG